MFARVFDKNKNTYYKSIVYSTVGVGWFLQYIVLNPITNSFDLVDHLDKDQSPAKPLVEIIQPECSEFNVYDEAFMLKYQDLLKSNNLEPMSFKCMTGYADMCENSAFLNDIFISRSVPVNAYKITIRELSDTNEWNYILTQSDADEFMNLFVGFHDSTLEKISYSETDNSNSLIATFDNSGWFGIVELCFERVEVLKILPAPEGYSRELFEGTLIVENESVFWADFETEEPDISSDGNIIKALSVKWRKI